MLPARRVGRSSRFRARVFLSVASKFSFILIPLLRLPCCSVSKDTLTREGERRCTVARGPLRGSLARPIACDSVTSRILERNHPHAPTGKSANHASMSMTSRTVHPHSFVNPSFFTGALRTVLHVDEPLYNRTNYPMPEGGCGETPRRPHEDGWLYLYGKKAQRWSERRN
ncbi:hypothetical protein C8R46DRAFT_269574 [Mycena filopes]|nr:hypothetical protein C8R46DRAFT_269574 [Mycena filopes]